VFGREGKGKGKKKKKGKKKGKRGKKKKRERNTPVQPECNSLRHALFFRTVAALKTPLRWVNENDFALAKKKEKRKGERKEKTCPSDSPQGPLALRGTTSSFSSSALLYPSFAFFPFRRRLQEGGKRKRGKKGRGKRKKKGREKRALPGCRSWCNYSFLISPSVSFGMASISGLFNWKGRRGGGKGKKRRNDHQARQRRSNLKIGGNIPCLKSTWGMRPTDWDGTGKGKKKGEKRGRLRAATSLDADASSLTIKVWRRYLVGSGEVSGNEEEKKGRKGKKGGTADE